MLAIVKDLALAGRGAPVSTDSVPVITLQNIDNPVSTNFFTGTPVEEKSWLAKTESSVRIEEEPLKQVASRAQDCIPYYFCANASCNIGAVNASYKSCTALTNIVQVKDKGVLASCARASSFQDINILRNCNAAGHIGAASCYWASNIAHDTCGPISAFSTGFHVVATVNELAGYRFWVSLVILRASANTHYSDIVTVSGINSRIWGSIRCKPKVGIS